MDKAAGRRLPVLFFTGRIVALLTGSGKRQSGGGWEKGYLKKNGFQVAFIRCQAVFAAVCGINRGSIGVVGGVDIVD